MEAIGHAQVYLTLGAFVSASRALSGARTAMNTISIFLREHQVVISHQSYCCVGSSACLHRFLIRSEQLHKGMHELLAEIELPRSILSNRPQLEGIHNAHIQQPPR